MRPRLRVIEGGLGSGPDGDGADPPETGPPAAWRIELVRPNAVDEGRIAAWRSLLVRLGGADPVLADPDYLVPAAQHLGRGDDPVFAFAVAVGRRREHLEGVVGLTMPHASWGRSRVGLWHPPGSARVVLINPGHEGAVAAALDARVGTLRSEVAIDLRAAARCAGPVPASSRSLRDIPARNLLGIRAAAPASRAPPEIDKTMEPGRIRDAVEAFLSLDARVSPRPIIADPSEAAMVRVVTRLFGRRHQTTVEIARRGGRVVAGRVRLGHGPRSVLWKQVREHDADRPAAEG